MPLLSSNDRSDPEPGNEERLSKKTAGDPSGSEVSHAELMRTLGKLVRGLSALFWGLPITLVVCVQTSRTDLFGEFGVLAPALANGLLLYGLLQIGAFRRQERVWRNALDRAHLLAIATAGLSPFLHWWRMNPSDPHFRIAVALLALSGLVFLFNLNGAIQRLTAMLPDETLRLEAHLFTTVNRHLITATLVLVGVWQVLAHLESPPQAILPALVLFDRIGLLLMLLLMLLPIALTMAMLWKIKETVFASVFTTRPSTPAPSV